MVFALLSAGVLVAGGCGPAGSGDHAPGLRQVDPYTLAGDKHLVRDLPPMAGSGQINVVVEIPAGTNAKWEVDKDSGQLRWEFREGKPRLVAYLGYPGNYGIVPGTLLPKETGGDGDPLDVILLGPAVARGAVVTARPIGVLKMLDGGERDDKILAVLVDSPLGAVTSLQQLRREFKGVAEIVELWFVNYKGPGGAQSQGFGNVREAVEAVRAAEAAYQRAHPAGN
jgi:inorganic pyrophosphatase